MGGLDDNRLFFFRRQAMKFYGNGMVWGDNAPLCRFEKREHQLGVLETDDPTIKKELLARGYPHDPEIITDVKVLIGDAPIADTIPEKKVPKKPVRKARKVVKKK
jgi:hypothetical protein